MTRREAMEVASQVAKAIAEDGNKLASERLDAVDRLIQMVINGLLPVGEPEKK